MIISNVLKEGTTKEIEEGMRWYRAAHKFAAEQGDVLRTAAALAALSPRNKWDRNKQDLVSVIKRGSLATTATFNANKEKAVRVLDEQTPLNNIRGILNGRKVISFYNNILHPSMDTTVTVDVWMYRVFNLPQKDSSYTIVEKHLQSYARSIGILPHDLQAILWVIGRRLHARDYNFQTGLFSLDLTRHKLSDEAVVGV